MKNTYFLIGLVTIILASGCVSQRVVTCIPSGNGENIQEALAKPGSRAMLCKNAVFDLRNPIVFTHENQEIVTEDLPTDDSRAILRLAHPDVVTAIDGEDVSGIKIRNIIVDGNRPRLGSYGVGKGLILIGGMASDQVVERVKAYEPRGWSTIHIYEGDVKAGKTCNNAAVTNSEFGPAGQPDGSWSDGISLACRNSLVANNMIVDATDGGIVIFQAPGSLIANNTIRSETRLLLGGINLVDYTPFKGDYRGTRVIGNIIDAAGAPIQVAMPMGERLAFCYDPESDDPRGDLPNRGAVVKNNTLKGEHMRYGFAAYGVEDWTVIDNIDLSTHQGTPVKECNERIPDPPSGFQKDPTEAKGIFQKEFVDAYLGAAMEAMEDHPPAKY